MFLSGLAACGGGEGDADSGVVVAADSGVVVVADSGVVDPDSGVVVVADSGAVDPDSGVIDSDSGVVAGDSGVVLGRVPRATRVARTTTIPSCTVFVDPASAAMPDGSAANPYLSLTAAVAAANDGAIICAAQGTYQEALSPGLKYFTLAGGFQSGSNFTVRDSALYPSKAQGDGTNIFLAYGDEGPTEGQLTAVDGFEITGYSQGILRIVYYSQRFDITNNNFHDNVCAEPFFGGAFALNNVSGTISGNVFSHNVCGRGAAGALNDSTNSNRVVVSQNWVDSNDGNGTDSHGGGLYLFCNDLTVFANELTNNRVSSWGGGLYIGSEPGTMHTTAAMSWNIYRDNRAGAFGGGFFCDDAATCLSDHEIYDGNCGGNIYVDSGGTDMDPTIALFDHMTNFRALDVDCVAPGAGLIVDKGNAAPDTYDVINSIFWGNGDGLDLATSCQPGLCNATVDVTYSLVQTDYLNNGVDVTFGAGNIAGADPLFADPAAQDLHLRSTFGRWTSAGYVEDGANSPALAAGDPMSPVPDNPDRAGDRTELGAYGNSPEASLVR